MSGQARVEVTFYMSVRVYADGSLVHDVRSGLPI